MIQKYSAIKVQCVKPEDDTEVRGYSYLWLKRGLMVPIVLKIMLLSRPELKSQVYCAESDYEGE